MYLPYLRGKQEEQLAVLEANPTIYSQKKVIPIFEPIKVGASNMKRYEKMCENDINFVLIVNPKVSGAPSQLQVLTATEKHLHLHSNFHLGLIVNNETTRNEIQHFLTLYKNLSKVLIHQGEYIDVTFLKSISSSVLYHVFREGRVASSYISAVGSSLQNVLLRDGFNRLPKNASYTGTEFFSDLHSTYKANNYAGFGDYQTISDYFSDGGGPAYAVAIHLTYKKDNHIEVEHFVSDNTVGNADVAGKFLEALTHLINSANRIPQRFFDSSGLDDFRDLYYRQHYPNLGKVKRCSIKHHLELIGSVI